MNFTLTKGLFITLPSKLWIISAVELLTCHFALYLVSKRTVRYRLPGKVVLGVAEDTGQNFMEEVGREPKRLANPGLIGEQEQVGYRWACIYVLVLSKMAQAEGAVWREKQKVGMVSQIWISLLCGMQSWV